ncbi:uncharacterized protein LACBIDRAFT_300632 [Laccaria bicolor S238N-H82]|uniref:Predicted protein n=1 Tax=Laccaria bicolor (strain S238N-H82 / ATCC MYA-4686) TaxID=486041 RepID=B0CPR8_LACBS|nr:uncharacterized protein LACBIDRAFT_300632 [Laccaria bicolor S238N-H82]EDR15582.1 predicted protein [Laccaria bicolor S238N-H82]|eukprot:XP_001873790.1 predicted protein [Laccaria bicolor S238N-H82]
MPDTLPKAALYYSPLSVWSAVALMTFEEKGYAKDEVDLRVVDLAKGENYNTSFLRLNFKATVPTLVVPLADTLADQAHCRYKALTETKVWPYFISKLVMVYQIMLKEIVEFLDKSRSALSHTHTTSSAPAPSLTPATIAASTICSVIIDILHSEEANPNHLRYVNARDEQSLVLLAKEVIPSLKGKQELLSSSLSRSAAKEIIVSERVKILWKEKLDATELLLEVLENAEKATADLDEKAKADRKEFFKIAQDAWGAHLKEVLLTISKEMVGLYTLADQYSIADLHLAGWLTRVVKLSGGTPEDDGRTIVKKLEEHIGDGFALPKEHVKDVARRERLGHDREAKLEAFWDAVKERESWKKVYQGGLF